MNNLLTFGETRVGGAGGTRRIRVIYYLDKAPMKLAYETQKYFIEYFMGITIYTSIQGSNVLWL